MLNELLNCMEEADEWVDIYPPQDFQKELMWYAIKANMVSGLLNSNREFLRLDVPEELSKNKINLLHNEVTEFNFSPWGIKKFLDGYQADFAEVYEDILNYVKRYVYFHNPNYYVLVALWVMGTYFYKIFNYYPYLRIVADKSSGKTTLMDVMRLLSFNSFMQSDVTSAVLFRTVHSNGVTFYMDEFDTYQKDVRAGMIDLLNTGFHKSGKTSRMDTVKNKYVKKEFITYSPKVLTGIYDINQVLADRCIKVPMLRKKATDGVEKFKMTTELSNFARNTRDKLYILGLNQGKEVYDVYNTNVVSNCLPNSLTDRQKDLWEGLGVIALQVGEEVFETLSNLAVEVSENAIREDSYTNPSYRLFVAILKVLKEIEPIKVSEGRHFYHSSQVYEHLKNINFISSTSKLTQELARLNILNIVVRVGEDTIRVYDLSQRVIEDLKQRFRYKEDDVEIQELPNI